MTETQKRNSSLFPGVTIFPELQRQKIHEHNKPREKKLQRVIGLNDIEFRRLENSMSEQQFKVFMGSVLKEEEPTVSSINEPEEKKPISGEPRTLHEKMQRQGWVVL